MEEAVRIRPGEELNKERLAEFLRSNMPVNDSGIEIKQFPAGSSNLTYLIMIGDDEYVLRRPPFGNAVKSAHDMRREFDVLSKLSTLYSPAPKPLLFCNDESVIGSEFYLMERRHGLIIRGSFSEARSLQKHARTAVSATASRSGVASKGEIEGVQTPENSHELRIEICKSFIQNLADLHALDYKRAGLGDLGKPEGYGRRQVEGWTKRYLAAKTHEHAELESAIKWLNENIPTESGASLVHNDYKFDNIMLDPNDLTKITAVLDWEMVTVGDPLMDLGTTLGYWMSRDAGDEMLDMPFNPRALMENISRDELVEMYAAASGREGSNVLFYYIFGTFKIAVIAQQIYARFARGFTRDERFAGLGQFAAKLGRIGVAALERKKLGDS